jgi:hypothetical protein
MYWGHTPEHLDAAGVGRILLLSLVLDMKTYA